MVKPRKDLSIPGALLIVVSQIASSFQSSEKIKVEIEKFREDFNQSIVDRETFFVRKTELTALNKKIDQLSNQVIRLGQHIRDMRHDEYSFMTEHKESSLVGCSYMRKAMGI